MGCVDAMWDPLLRILSFRLTITEVAEQAKLAMQADLQQGEPKQLGKADQCQLKWDCV